MKLLFITPIKVDYPPKDGASIATFYRIFYLKKYFDTECDIITSGDDISKNNLEKSNIFRKVYVYEKKDILYSNVKSFFSIYIFSMIRNSLSMKDIENILKNFNFNEYNCINFEHSYSYYIYKQLSKYVDLNKYKKAFWAHNVDYLYFYNLYKESKSIKEKFINFLNYIKLKFIEPNYLRSFDNIFTLAYHDNIKLKTLLKQNNIYWIPVNVANPEPSDKLEKDIIKLKHQTKHCKYKILFTGKLNHISNIQAVLWFHDKVFPLIKQALGNVCFIIVGFEPNSTILNLVNDRDILLYKNVDSVSTFFYLSDLFVIPLFNDAGIKIKLIEAIKHNIKIVARPEALIGANLIDTIPNAKSEKDFANLCIKALKNEIDYKPILEKARQYFDDKKNLRLFLSICQDSKLKY